MQTRIESAGFDNHWVATPKMVAYLLWMDKSCPTLKPGNHCLLVFTLGNRIRIPGFWILVVRNGFRNHPHGLQLGSIKQDSWDSLQNAARRTWHRSTSGTSSSQSSIRPRTQHAHVSLTATKPLHLDNLVYVNIYYTEIRSLLYIYIYMNKGG